MSSVCRVSCRMLLLLLPIVAPTLRAQEPAKIFLSSRVIDTRAPEAGVAEGLRARPEEDVEDQIVLVKFPAPVTAGQMRALRAASLRIYTYLPDHAFLVKVPARSLTRARLATLGATWSGPWHPAYKISPALAAVAPGADKAKSAYQQVLLQIFPDADLAEVVRQIRDLGLPAQVGAQRGRSFSRVRLLLSPAEIAEHREDLARLRNVFWIDLEGRKALRNDTTVWVGQSGLSGGQTTPIFS
jgi:hypothetical protein